MSSVFRGALHRSGNALETDSFKDSSAVVFKCLDFDGIVVLLGHRSHRSVSEPSVQRKPVPYKIPLKHREFWRSVSHHSQRYNPFIRLRIPT